MCLEKIENKLDGDKIVIGTLPYSLEKKQYSIISGWSGFFKNLDPENCPIEKC